MTDVDDYLARMPSEARGALQRLRETISAAAPEATEVISYGVPAFRHHGMLVSYGAAKKHLSFYCMSTAVMEAHASELSAFKLGKGSVQFTPDRPIPDALVTKLVKARVAENQSLR